MNYFEKNFHLGKWSLRISWHQVALWREYEPLIDWLTPWSDRMYTMPKGLYIGHRSIITYGN